MSIFDRIRDLFGESRSGYGGGNPFKRPFGGQGSSSPFDDFDQEINSCFEDMFRGLPQFSFEIEVPDDGSFGDHFFQGFGGGSQGGLPNLPLSPGDFQGEDAPNIYRSPRDYMLRKPKSNTDQRSRQQSRILQPSEVPRKDSDLDDVINEENIGEIFSGGGGGGSGGSVSDRLRGGAGDADHPSADWGKPWSGWFSPFSRPGGGGLQSPVQGDEAGESFVRGFGRFMETTRRTRADGTIEERRVVRDSSGHEEVTTTIYDSSGNILSQRQPDSSAPESMLRRPGVSDNQGPATARPREEGGGFLRYWFPSWFRK